MQTLKILEQIIRDMQPWASLVTEGSGEEFAAIVQEEQAISALIPLDPGAVQAVFDVLYPPSPDALCHPDLLAEWRQLARPQTRLSVLDAMRGQGTFYQRLFALIPRVLGILAQIAAVGGNVEGVQTVGQNSSILIQEQAKLGMVVAKFDRAKASVEAYQLTQDDIERCIHTAILESPTRSVPFAMGGGLQ